MVTVPYSSSDYLKTDDDIIDYLEAAMEDGDSRVLLLALRNAAIAATYRQHKEGRQTSGAQL